MGIKIAEGLDYLHRKELIHRDVKPSNLIFIDGKCRLADIGLVALLGQRSFVGTEGFVAPEGPGTAASDIFSLGMVLLWVYFSAQILLVGAEFTCVYARTFGSRKNT